MCVRGEARRVLPLLRTVNCGAFCQEVDGADSEMSGTLQAKKRALLGQKDRLRLLKKMQSGKERVQRKMERGRSSKGEEMRSGETGSMSEIKPVVREARYVLVATILAFDIRVFLRFYFEASVRQQVSNTCGTSTDAQSIAHLPPTFSVIELAVAPLFPPWKTSTQLCS